MARTIRAMEIQDIRRARLSQLINERYDGSQAKFIEETGENQGEISGLLRNKSFGEKKARKLESKSGLERGWLDRPLSLEPAAGREPTAVSRPHLSVVGTAQHEWMALVYVSREELDLLSEYRRATKLGKTVIEAAAHTATKDESLPGAAHQP